MMVVGVAMLGSLTVLPALLSQARRQDREGPHPVPAPAPPPERRQPLLVGDPHARRCAIRSSRRVAATTVLIVMAVPVLQPAHRAVRARLAPEERADRRHDQQDPGRRSRAASTRRSSRSRRTPTRPRPSRRRRPEAARRSRAGQMHGPITVDVNPAPHRRPRRDPARRQGHRRGSNAALDTLRNEILPATIGNGPGRDLRASRAARRPPPTRTRS